MICLLISFAWFGFLVGFLLLDLGLIWLFSLWVAYSGCLIGLLFYCLTVVLLFVFDWFAVLVAYEICCFEYCLWVVVACLLVVVYLGGFVLVVALLCCFDCFYCVLV